MPACLHETSTDTGRMLGPAALPEQHCTACGAKFVRQPGKPDGIVQYESLGFAMIDFGDASRDPRDGRTRHSRMRIHTP